MKFIAVEVAYEAAELVKKPIEALTRQNRSLGDQALRAASSIVLNLEEGNCRTGADRLHMFRIAEGSTKELRAALRLATMWRQIDVPVQVMALLDRLSALIYGLTHRRR
jgi:four helix bundle protein